MVGVGGLEPPTSILSGSRSNLLSYTPPAVLYHTHAKHATLRSRDDKIPRCCVAVKQKNGALPEKGWSLRAPRRSAVHQTPVQAIDRHHSKAMEPAKGSALEISCDQFDTLPSHERHAGMGPGSVVEDVARIIRRCFGTLARFYFFLLLTHYKTRDKLNKKSPLLLAFSRLPDRTFFSDFIRAFVD